MGSIPQLSIVKGPTRRLQINTLHDIFENIATGQYENNTALIFEVDGEIRQHSFAELNSFANKLARTIQSFICSKNLPRNKDGDYIVAVNMHPSDHLVMVLLAIWKAGAAYMPLDPAFPGPRIEHIVKEANPVLIIFDEDSDFYGDTPKLSFNELVHQCKSQAKGNLLENERLQHLKLDLAIVLYTSGSTGIPKGVRLPHKVILNRLQWQFKRFPYSNTENVCVFKTALTFVDSVSEIWGPLLRGRSILVVPKVITKDPENLIALLEKYKVERLILVPTLLKSLLMYLKLKGEKSTLRNLKTWICSGEILTVSLAEEFYRWFSDKDHQLCNFYGSTEIMGDVTYFVVPGLQELKHMDKIPIGIPVDNTIVYLLDNEFRPVKSGDIGELFVSGSNLAAGYVNGRDPEKFLKNQLTIDLTYARLYRTGDFARLEKGVLFYEGRTDSQVKIRGHRVDMMEVEKAVSSIDGVEKAIVLCYKPGDIDQALLAFVKSNNLQNERGIENAIKEKLTSYMVPQVILIEKVPLLVNGKIDRQTLLKYYENTNNNDDSKPEVEIDYEGVPPHQMEAAKVLFETVGYVLNRSARFAISIKANFFEIGGNSLNSIYTISRLNEHGYQIKISDFLSAVDFGEVLLRMTSDTKMNNQIDSFSSELLQPSHKNIVSDMIAASFYEKADLEQWIKSDVSLSDYYELIDKLWEPLLEKKLSFIIKTKSGEIIGTALNFDVRDEPEVELQSKLTVVFEFLEAIEGPVRDSQLSPEKGENLHSFMMATHSSLTPKENVAVMQFIEGEVLNLAERRHFKGVFTTNTNPLTQQLGYIYNYQVLSDIQVNQYVASDNTKPFALAPDDQRAIVSWKSIV
uniref:Ebony2 n=1 Tax=Leptinotarsa decemlineata TaxID=7539 RepID=A0A290GB23_LEPDE|nr:Ebony2 [Leptinotarsa decemlineata]